MIKNVPKILPLKPFHKVNSSAEYLAVSDGEMIRNYSQSKIQHVSEFDEEAQQPGAFSPQPDLSVC